MSTDFLHGVEVVTVAGGPRPIQTIRSSVIGLIGTAPAATDEAFPLDTPVLVNRPADFAGIGATGTLPGALADIFAQIGALVVVIRVDEGADADATLANIVGGVDVNTGARTGIQAFKDAQTHTGVTPMLLVAPSFTGARKVDPVDNTKHLKNPVADALATLAASLRAHAVVGGPNTTDADAIDYRKDFGTRRVYIVDPFVKVSGAAGATESHDAAASVAGLIARTDTNKGFWKSPSNEELNGVLGLDRAIDYALGDSNTRANLLNENQVATIIRDDGFRLWGNHTAAPEGDAFQFLCVSRTADMIDVSIQTAHRWACDEGITRGYFDDVVSSVNNYLRDLTARGAILGGKCWVDPALNGPDQIKNGHATFSYEFTPTYPAERVTFRSSITDTFLTSLFAAS